MMGLDDQPRRVWYCLMDPNGNAFGATSATSVELTPSDTTVDTFRDAMVFKTPNTLKGMPAHNLKVYRNKASLDKSIKASLENNIKASLEKEHSPIKVDMNQDSEDMEDAPLRPWQKLSGLGNSGEANTLMVVVRNFIDPKSECRKLERPMQFTRSDWFRSDLMSRGPPCTFTTDEWMSMTYNGMVSNVTRPLGDHVNVVCKSFEMKFPPLLDACAGSHEEVFVRPCYEKLFDVLVKCIAQKIKSVNVVVTGNPGIGKSRFFSYCVFRLSNAQSLEGELLQSKESLLESKTPTDNELFTEVKAMKGKTLIVNSGNMFFVHENGAFHKLKNDDLGSHQCRKNVVRLVNRTSTQLLAWSGVSILFTSPGADNYAGYLKSDGTEFIMPPWTYQELLMAARVMKLTEGTVRQRFLQFGGIARLVFSDEQGKFEGELSEAISEVDPSALIRLVRLQGGVGTTQSYNHKLLQMLPKHNEEEYEGFFLSFASPRIAFVIFQDLCLSRYESLKTFLVKNTDDKNSAALRGSMFEELCHDMWSRSGKHKLKGRYLTCGKAFSLAVHNRPAIHLFSELDQIPEFLPRVPMYCRPDAKRYPWIDAVYWDTKTCFLLQMTAFPRCSIADDHWLTILKWSEERNLKKPPVLVSVVPKDKVHFDKMQKLLKSVTQNKDLEMKSMTQCVVGVQVAKSLYTVKKVSGGNDSMCNIWNQV